MLSTSPCRRPPPTSSRKRHDAGRAAQGHRRLFHATAHEIEEEEASGSTAETPPTTSTQQGCSRRLRCAAADERDEEASAPQRRHHRRRAPNVRAHLKARIEGGRRRTTSIREGRALAAEHTAGKLCARQGATPRVPVSSPPHSSCTLLKLNVDAPFIIDFSRYDQDHRWTHWSGV
jgi:hypothetical protein